MEDNGDVDFSPKLYFWENHKNTFFAIFYLKQARKKNHNFKLLLKRFIDLEHLFGCCVFYFVQVFADFLSSMPNKTKIDMNFKKSAETWKMRKPNIQMNVLSR